MALALVVYTHSLSHIDHAFLCYTLHKVWL